MILHTDYGDIELYIGRNTSLCVDKIIMDGSSRIELTTDFRPASDKMKKIINEKTMEMLQKNFDEHKYFYKSKTKCNTLKEVIEKFGFKEIESCVSFFMREGVVIASITVVYINDDIKMEESLRIDASVSEDVLLLEQLVIDMIKDDFANSLMG